VRKKKRKASAKQIAWRKKFAAKYGRKSISSVAQRSATKTRTTRGVPMARRRRISRPRRFARSVRRSKSARKGVSELALIGYAVVGENLFDQLTSSVNVGVSPRIIKIGAGYFLKKKSGIVGQLGTAMYTIELYKLGKDIASGGLNLGNLLGNQPATASPSSNNGATFS